jgi:hypothetical protein
MLKGSYTLAKFTAELNKVSKAFAPWETQIEPVQFVSPHPR